jgi:predicted transcriptional regulator
MNIQTTAVMAPPAPKQIHEMQLPVVMMRDILIKTMFRKNVDMVTELARAVCLPVQVTQELIDMARDQRLIEATGTLNANNGNEMGYKLTDAGKARALDALTQSEYYGAMPVPLDVYREQVKRQSIRNLMITRQQLTDAMGHLVLPDELIGNLGPAVSAGRSILMYGPPGNGKSSISNGIRDAIRSMCHVQSNMRARSLRSMTRLCTALLKTISMIRHSCAARLAGSIHAMYVASDPRSLRVVS